MDIVAATLLGDHAPLRLLGATGERDLVLA
jgi:hypothetical protein